EQDGVLLDHVTACQECSPIKKGNPGGNGYLRRFYDLDPKSQNHKIRRIRSASAMEEKIKNMQNFFGLRETGRLDAHTLDTMKQARCGVPDVDNFSFYPSRPRWRKNTITYSIARCTGDLKKEEVERSFRSALKMWSDVTPLKFTKVDHGRADIVLSFASVHGDFFPFDGPRGVLAHAYQPGEGIGGDVHFDDDESWTGGKKGLLWIVACRMLVHSSACAKLQDIGRKWNPLTNTMNEHGASQTCSRGDMSGEYVGHARPGMFQLATWVGALHYYAAT
uniref:Matrix metallopeptidase 20a (enamelysin) n=1 Tax=Gouania willdenowi TaxID=441366 RepID=A0A8C5G874_GOUWI